MNDYKNLSDDKSEKFGEAFRQATALSFSVFGPHAFRKFTLGKANNPDGEWERPINRPLFDVVMWGFTRFDKNQIMQHSDAIRDKLISLLTEDNVFLDSITAAVADKNKTHFRFELWHDALKEIILTGPQQRAFSSNIRRQLYDTNRTCAICGQTIHSIDDAHVDHIIPYSAGGKTTLDNAQLTHRFCNIRKSDR